MIVGLQRRMVWLLAVLCTLPWAYLQKDVVIPGDMAWLTGAAQHILSGHRMSEFYFDNNPPLCYIIYIPVALLVNGGLPIWVAAYAFTMAFVAFFTVLTVRLLLVVPGVEGVRFWGTLAGYFVAVTALCQLEFGNKDHLIAVALFPFLLAQYALTYKLAIPRWVLWLTIIAATPFILVKPHYGLLCVLMLAHRFWRERRFSIVLNPDFLSLAVGVILYAASIVIWFPDFISEILVPVSIHLYAQVIINDVFLASIGIGILAISLLTLAFFDDGDKNARKFTLFLCCMALAADIPLFVQMKGFYLHMLPALAFLVPAAIMTASLYIKRFKPCNHIYPALIITGMAIFSYLFIWTNPFPNHSDYQKSSFAKYVSEHARDSSFLMQSTTTNVIVPVSVYTGVPHATRFSNFWFIYSLYLSGNLEMKDYFSGLVAEDLDRYKPAFVALYHKPVPGDDFIKMFGGSPAFDSAWARYRKVDEIEIDYSQFYKRKTHRMFGYHSFDIYQRQ